MARYKTFVNAGSVLPADLNAIQDDYEHAFSVYRTLIRARGACDPSAGGGGARLVALNGTDPVVAIGTTAAARKYAFYLDPADFGAGSRAVKLRIRGQVTTNAVDPAVTYTWGLYPVSTWTGASGADPAVNGIGTVVTGSAPAGVTPGAAAQTSQLGADFTCPAAGWYVICVLVNPQMAPNSVAAVIAELQLRQV